MSRASMATAVREHRSPVFGIGTFTGPEGRIDFEIGWPEFERDVRWAERALATWDVGRGDHVLLTTPNCEGPWASPLIRALRESGAIHSNAEIYSWDAPRVMTFLRLLPVSAFIGLTADTASALVESDAATRLAEVRLLWARPDAAAILRTAGLRPALLVKLGPALGLECPRRDGVHVDPGEWRIGSGLGGATVTTVGARTYEARDLPTGVAGSVRSAPCPCGLPGPRFRVDGTGG